MTDLERAGTPILIAMVAIASVVGYLFLFPSSPLYYNPKASTTGVFLTGCMYDASGNQVGCSYSKQLVIGQSVTGAGGASIASIKVPSAYAKLNYTGQVSSWSYSATETVQYDKGVSDSYAAISASGNGNPPKSFNITLPKSAWTSSELEGRWTGYGGKLVNVSVIQSSLSVTFANGVKITKPSAFNYLVQFTLNYGQTSTTTTSTSTTLQTSTTTTSTSTTISDGSVSSGTQDVWTTTVTSATDGQTGSLAQSGIIVDVQPYSVQSGFSLAFVYIPTGYPLPACASGSCGQVTIVSKSVSVGAFGLALTAGSWTQANIPIATSAGDLVLVQVFQSNTQIFSSAVTISPPTTAPSTGVAQVPVAPYTDSYLAQLNQSTLSGELTVKCYSPQGQPIYTNRLCLALSVVSVQF